MRRILPLVDGSLGPRGPVTIGFLLALLPALTVFASTEARVMGPVPISILRFLSQLLLGL